MFADISINRIWAPQSISKQRSDEAVKQSEGDEVRMMSLIEENERLRAALVETRNRIVELEQLADTDTLTPLPNRRAFLRRLEAVVQYAARHDTPAAILYIDLDGLKRINDDHGHHVGDAVLLHLARLLTENLRATDMVARIGGDEFGLILDHLNEDDAKAKARTLAEYVSDQRIDVGAATLAIRVTIGLAMVRAGESVADLIERADAAMYANRHHRSHI
jgi:diguanylate cyclase (GGDEF)-like protein